jgi:hypothetical protein
MVKEEDRKRANKACLNCRSRKAKCEFDGDSTNCVRCQREDKQCVFIASRRGGRSNVEKGRLARLRRQYEANEQTTVEIDPAIAFGTLHNPSDSLDLLARTAFSKAQGSDEDHYHGFQHGEVSTNNDDDDGDESMDGTRTDPELSFENGTHSRDSEIEQQQLVPHSLTRTSTEAADAGDDLPIPFTPPAIERMGEFYLIAHRIINPTQLRTFVATFFARHHHYLPLIPAKRIPSTDESLVEFATQEPILLATFVLIASRFENTRAHDACWSYMKGVINDLVLGMIPPTVGAVEAMLLIAENIPRHPEVGDANLHKVEARIAWNLIGLAIRMGYYLGFDQKTLIRRYETMDEDTHRMRLVWTYCYMHDRQASVRLGKAFWSRGPSLCFENPCITSNMYKEAFVNFPTLIPSANSPEDYACLMQAHIELTQILTNIHDSLYPSRDRTIALVRVGEYYKILDEFTRSFSAYRFAWKEKHWKMFPLNETVWMTFHYAKLYAYAFAFQAHVRRHAKLQKRMQEDNSNELRRAQVRRIFPRGVAGSVDAKFILESKKAAYDILEICINQLYKGGALAYLPARYYGYLTYAAVFLIKVAFTGAVGLKEQRYILNLIKRLIACFSDDSISSDRQHPLVRCGNQLRMLVRTIWTAEGLADEPAHGESEEESSMLSKAVDDSFQQSVDAGPSPTEFSFSLVEGGSDAALEDLTALLSIDLDSEVWLSYFNQTGAEPYLL